MHWQRAYALKSDKEVIKTFSLAACIFIMVPLSLSLLGFVAAGQYLSGTWKVVSNQMIGPATVYHFAPYLSIPFTVMLLSGLCSTLDSILCAMSSLTVIDILQRSDDSNLPKPVSQRNLRSARIAMLPPAAIGFCIATIPHLSIQDLFLFYGTVRASTLIPTMTTLLWPTVRSKAIFSAVLLSLLLGAPVLGFGEILGNAHWREWLSVPTYLDPKWAPNFKFAGSMAVVTIGIVCCYLGLRTQAKTASK